MSKQRRRQCRRRDRRISNEVLIKGIKVETVLADGFWAEGRNFQYAVCFRCILFVLFPVFMLF